MNSAQTLALAVQQHQTGNLREAEQLYRQILNAEPDHADALNLLGVLAHQVGQSDTAIELIRSVLRFRPGFAEAHGNLGAVLRALGRMDEAAANYERALALKPDYPEAHHNLGRLRQAQGKLDEAAAHFRHALHLRPTYAEAHHQLGTILQMQGQLAEAITCFEQAITLKPNFAEAHNNLGSVLGMQGKLDQAVASCERAILLDPNHVEAHNNLGTARLEQGKLDEAAASFRQALLLRPDFAEAHGNLGSVLKAQGRQHEALRSFEDALRIKPDFADAHMNRSLLWLLQADFERGWQEYEWRWNETTCPRRHVDRPAWNGEPLAGRTILLHFEQGLGDTLQFIRYAPLVKSAGAGNVLLECQVPLKRLLTGCRGVDRIYVFGEPLPHFDVQAPLLRLPRLLGTTSLERIPGGVPYLSVPDDLVLHWRKRLESVKGFRIGIAWQGSPTHKADRRRSVPLPLFAPISRVTGMRLISLQMGPGSEQCSALPGLLDLTGAIADFADTAALLKNLDLVITVDTSVAHLAGALGVPAWVALPFDPDWRWLLGREDSPWYPSLRLFRQSRPADWDGVFERMAAALSSAKPQAKVNY